MKLNAESLAWILVFTVASLAILISNILTIIAFTNGHFKRKRTFILLINLAVSDIVIGMIAIPLYMSIAFFGHPENNFVYLCFDVLSGFASIFTIGLISLERLSAVAFPLRHLLFRPKHYVVAIMFIWLGAVVETVILRIILPYNYSHNVIRAHITVVSIAIPLFITFASYFALYILEQKSFAHFQGQKSDERESKLGRTLMIITTMFFVTWSPFALANVIDIYSCARTMCTHLPENFYIITKLLQYINSLINPAVYAMRIPAFQHSLKQLSCKVFRQKKFEMTAKFVQLNRNLSQEQFEMHTFESPALARSLRAALTLSLLSIVLHPKKGR